MKRILFISVFLIMVFSIIAGVSASDNEVKLGIKVNYEYNDKINPEIELKESNKILNFTKTYNSSKKQYQLTFLKNTSSGNNFNVKISAPGYITQSKKITVNSNVIFSMKATASYKLGRETTKNANKAISFSKAKEMLVITTAGMTYYKGKTSENVLEGIINAAGGKITYGKGNLLTLSSKRTDPTNTAFIYKTKNNKLYMVYFKNGSLKPSYVGTISNLNSNQWKNIQKRLNKEDAYSTVSIAHSWAAGLSSDVLTQAAYHGHVCGGLISGQAMIEILLKNYPPRGEFGINPLENTVYYVLGVPGGSEDDSFLWTMDITPGKRAYIGIDTMVSNTMTGFIRWNTSSNTGILIIMSYDENKTKKEFIKLYPTKNPDKSISNDLTYQKWLIKQLKSNPEKIAKINYQFKGLNQTHLNYLMGEEPTTGNVTQRAHGLDMDYILNLYKNGILTKSKAESSENVKLNMTNNKLKQIANKATEMALKHFKKKNIDLKDNSNLFVFTSAGYIRLNSLSTEIVYDALFDKLGSRLSRKTLLPVHTSIWKDLVFDFVLVEGDDIYKYNLGYDAINNKLIEKNNSNYNFRDIYMYDPPYDLLISWLFHNHVCPGSSPGLAIADHIFNEFPLDKNERYIYITTDTNCKDDVLNILLGVSPGMGNYYNLRDMVSNTGTPNENMDVGIIIKWNDETNAAIAANINWKGLGGDPDLEKMIKWYTGDSSIDKSNISSPTKKLISSSDLEKLISGGLNTKEGNSLSYLMNLPDRSLSDLISSDSGVDDVGGVSSDRGNSYQGSRNSIGLNMVSAANPTSSVGDKSSDESIDSSEDSSSDGDAYEVTKEESTEGSNSYNWIYAVIIVLILAALAGFGFIRWSKK